MRAIARGTDASPTPCADLTNVRDFRVPRRRRVKTKAVGSGLRLMEAHRLRIKDIVLERGEVIVRDAKGGKDRVTVLPVAIVAPII